MHYICNLKNFYILLYEILLISVHKKSTNINKENKENAVESLILSTEFYEIYTNLYIYTKETQIIFYTKKEFDVLEIVSSESIKNIKFKTSKIN